MYFDDSKYNSIAARMIDADNVAEVAKDGTAPWREYIAKEGVQQYRDYYEDASEE